MNNGNEMSRSQNIYVMKNRFLCLCVNYWRLKAVAVRDTYQISRKDECIDLLGFTLIASTIDPNCSYWQVQVAYADPDKTAFTLHYGLYMFAGMPCRLVKAPSFFHRTADVTLSSVKSHFALLTIHHMMIFL